jgi:RNA polymerase sigma-70 factor (ECF subfamily)
MLSSTAEAISDAALVERAQQADEAAFAALYRRHARYLAGIVYRLMGDSAELDDIIQETFLQASDALARLEQPDRVRAWLVTIAVRRAHRHLARRHRRWFMLCRLAEVAAPSSDPAVRSDVDELYRTLDRLPENLRIPWILHRIEQLSLPAVAEVCEVSLATVKRRIAEAEQRIERRRTP